MRRFLIATTLISLLIVTIATITHPLYALPGEEINPVAGFLLLAVFLPMVLIVIFMFLPESITDWIDELTED